ncbi:hypothetical protein, partial [Vibrio parahaemolyticus]
ADRIEALQRAGALPQPVRGLLDDMADWLGTGTTDPAQARRLKASASALEPEFGERPSWNGLVLASLLARLRDFIDLRQDTRLL